MNLIWHVAIRNMLALGYDTTRNNVIDFHTDVENFIYELGAQRDYWGSQGVSCE